MWFRATLGRCLALPHAGLDLRLHHRLKKRDHSFEVWSWVVDALRHLLAQVSIDCPQLLDVAITLRVDHRWNRRGARNHVTEPHADDHVRDRSRGPSVASTKRM